MAKHPIYATLNPCRHNWLSADRAPRGAKPIWQHENMIPGMYVLIRPSPEIEGTGRERSAYHTTLSPRPLPYTPTRNVVDLSQRPPYAISLSTLLPSCIPTARENIRETKTICTVGRKSPLLCYLWSLLAHSYCWVILSFWLLSSCCYSLRITQHCCLFNTLCLLTLLLLCRFLPWALYPVKGQVRRQTRARTQSAKPTKE